MSVRFPFSCPTAVILLIQSEDLKLHLVTVLHPCVCICWGLQHKGIDLQHLCSISRISLDSTIGEQGTSPRILDMLTEVMGFAAPVLMLLDNNLSGHKLD